MQNLIDLLDAHERCGAGVAITIDASAHPHAEADFHAWAKSRGLTIEDNTHIGYSHSCRSMRLRGSHNRGSVCLVFEPRALAGAPERRVVSVPVVRSADTVDRPAFADEPTAEYELLPMSDSGRMRITRDLRVIDAVAREVA